MRDVTLGLGLGWPLPSLTLALSYHPTAAACPRAWAVGGEELDHLRGLPRPPPKPKRKPKPKVSARTPRPWPGGRSASRTTSSRHAHSCRYAWFGLGSNPNPQPTLTLDPNPNPNPNPDPHPNPSPSPNPKQAWGITVHAAQGLTIDRLQVDLGRIFADGQVYLAPTHPYYNNNYYYYYYYSPLAAHYLLLTTHSSLDCSPLTRLAPPRPPSKA